MASHAIENQDEDMVGTERRAAARIPLKTIEQVLLDDEQSIDVKVELPGGGRMNKQGLCVIFTQMECVSG